MDETAEKSTNSFCYVCLCDNDEKRLSLFNVQNELLKTILQLERLCLCYVCKRLAQHAETFIHSVQNNQIFMENFDNVSTITLETLKAQTPPAIDLTFLPLEPIFLSPDENGVENCIVVSNGPTRHSERVKIKMEVKDEEEFGGDDDFGGDELDAHIKEEDEYPLKQLKKELGLEGVDIKIRKKKRKIKTKFSVQKKKRVRGIAKDIGNFAKNVQIIKRTKKEIIKEREEMEKSEKYVNSPFKCTFCVKGFTFKGSYDTHMEKHDESKGDFECDVCKMRMDSADKLEQHQKYHRVRYKCLECGKEYVQRTTVRDHYTAHHCKGAYQFMCNHCCKDFNRQASLRKHIWNVHNKTQVMCDYCNKSYSGKEGLKNHLKLKHAKEVSATARPRNIVCKECGMTFLSPSHLKLHSTKHSDVRDFYCVECDKSFKSENALKQHLRIAAPHTNYLELPFKCDQCDKRYSCRRDVVAHANRVHFNIRPFQCDLCDKSYLNKWNLKDHKRYTHDGERRPHKYPCGFCDKVFDVSTNLCSQAYTRQDSLVMHKRRTHDGDSLPRKFLCHFCDKSFNRNRILKDHIRTHTGERPYQCSSCPANFTQAGVLATHVKLIHLKLTRDGRPKNQQFTVNID